jgi:hypothetical protein
MGYDDTNDLVYGLLSQFEQRYLSEGIDEMSPVAVRAFSKSFKRPYICALFEDLRTGRWQMGKTQEQISNSLGFTDRSWVSDAERLGEVSLDVYMRLRCWPTRPSEWEPDILRLRRDMCRSGIIGIACFFAGFVNDRPSLIPSELSELDYEMLFELFRDYRRWMIRRLRSDNEAKEAAVGLLRAVVDDPLRNINPRWLKKSERDRISLRIQRLCESPAIAFDYLCQLQSNWQDLFAVSQAVCEGLKDFDHGLLAF